MKIVLNLIVIIFLATSLSGCIVVGGDHWRDKNGSWEDRQLKNQSVINQLELNDSRQVVLKQLGAPDFSEAFTKGGDNYRILFYRTQHEHSDGKTSKDETTPLVFKNEKLIGWGMDALNSVR